MMNIVLNSEENMSCFSFYMLLRSGKKPQNCITFLKAEGSKLFCMKILNNFIEITMKLLS